MRKIVMPIFFLVLLALPASAIEDYSAPQNNATEPTSPNSCANLQAQVSQLQKQVEEIKANSMTANDFKVLELNIYAKIDKFLGTISSQIIITFLITFAFAIVLLLLLRAKRLI